jgi:hypothetical protein
MSRPAGTGPPASRGGGDSARSLVLRDDAQFLRFAAAGRVSYHGAAITGVVLPILVYWRTLVTAKPSCRAGSWPSTPEPSPRLTGPGRELGGTAKRIRHRGEPAPERSPLSQFGSWEICLQIGGVVTVRPDAGEPLAR